MVDKYFYCNVKKTIVRVCRAAVSVHGAIFLFVFKPVKNNSCHKSIKIKTHNRLYCVKIRIIYA